MRKLFLGLMHLFLVGNLTAQQKEQIKFSISSLDKSLFFERLTYRVSLSELTVEQSSDLSFGKTSEKPKRLFQMKLDSSEIIKLYQLNPIVENDSLKENYHNLCVIDGLILDFDFVIRTGKKSLSLSNYYVSQMQPFVDFVNLKVPSLYKIWYDRVDLEKEMKDCPKNRLLQY